MLKLFRILQKYIYLYMHVRVRTYPHPHLCDMTLQTHFFKIYSIVRNTQY